ncbi:hypothetical protein NE237_005365 [Protea cynaroides]|uniref:Uncharacterized protein n=1 Tax=Protea cynaroides TaxID=273540 RepID=A0A9Q0KKN9_9MAGN|nr:hypothetical protein NE237_005365 [Protea cynaroides]
MSLPIEDELRLVTEIGKISKETSKRVTGCRILTSSIKTILLVDSSKWNRVSLASLTTQNPLLLRLHVLVFFVVRIRFHSLASFLFSGFRKSIPLRSGMQISQQWRPQHGGGDDSARQRW